MPLSTLCLFYMMQCSLAEFETLSEAWPAVLSSFGLCFRAAEASAAITPCSCCMTSNSGLLAHPEQSTWAVQILLCEV